MTEATGEQERCERCDRTECKRRLIEHHPACMNDSPIPGCDGCAAERDCEAHAVDWRARALAAENRHKQLTRPVTDPQSGVAATWTMSADDSAKTYIESLEAEAERLSNRLAAEQATRAAVEEQLAKADKNREQWQTNADRTEGERARAWSTIYQIVRFAGGNPISMAIEFQDSVLLCAHIESFIADRLADRDRLAADLANEREAHDDTLEKLKQAVDRYERYSGAAEGAIAENDKLHERMLDGAREMHAEIDRLTALLKRARSALPITSAVGADIDHAIKGGGTKEK